MESPFAALARKYRAMADLRRAHAAGGGTATPAVLRALAAEFPGALRELDALTLETLDRRAEALTAAADGTTPAEPWMTWLQGYHGLLRAALRVKRRVARAPVIPDARADALAREATEAAGIPLDAAFVRAVAHPPGGRINGVVFARLGEHLGVAPEAVWDALFPTRRPDRFRPMPTAEPATEAGTAQAPRPPDGGVPSG